MKLSIAILIGAISAKRLNEFFMVPSSFFEDSLVESDPIYGTLGAPKLPATRLTDEQKFEQNQRTFKPREWTHDQEQVKDTDNSIKIAEKLVGSKMPSPSDPEQKVKIAKEKHVQYYFHDSDDEDDDTYQTRKSLKAAEKSLKTRFFINKADQQDYEKAKAANTLR